MRALIELAPNHKVGLSLAHPVMPAAGCFGLGIEYSRLIEFERLGAIVVGPVTADRRKGSEPPRLVPVAGGVLLHTGLANPGISRVIRRAEGAWRRSPVPVIVHVAATDSESVTRCCSRLSTLDSVAGIELGLPDLAAPEQLEEAVWAARTAAIQPLVVRLPLARAAELCELSVVCGADALTIAGPPCGTLWHAPERRFIDGCLYGPLVLPLVLTALRTVRRRVAVPLVGCGGIYDIDGATAMLECGASAVQVSAAIWRDPSCLPRIARGLAA